MFAGYDCWVEQYIKDIDSPENVVISCNDTTAWKNNPDHNWVYNKLELCKSQGIAAGPHGVRPDIEPVFSKPMINLHGKNLGAHKIFNWVDSEYQPGHFWMPVLTGTHLTSDLALVDGVCQWIYTMQAFEEEDGNISRYESANDEAFMDLTDKVKLWALQNLKGYTGIVNIESIGSKIIDCHLRMTSRFVDIYGEDWLNAVVVLYSKDTWRFERGHKLGVSYSLRAPETGVYAISDKEHYDILKKKSWSIQLIVRENEEIQEGDRLAIVNGHDAEQVNEIINELNDVIILTTE